MNRVTINVKLLVDEHGEVFFNGVKCKSSNITSSWLICTAFHGGKPDDKDVVAHFDDNGGNNHPSNLRWATYKENSQDAIRNGRKVCGERINTAKITEADVVSIRQTWNDGKLNRAEIAHIYGFSWDIVNDVVTRKTWKHVA